MGKISKKEVEHMARLARLDMTDRELSSFSDQLSSLLEYMEVLNKADTEEVEPRSQVIGLSNVSRSDEVRGCEPDVRDRIMENVPDKKDDFVRTLPVF